MNRFGFTLLELLVASVVAAILGTALTRLLVNDSRFVNRQEAMLSARRTARTALNWMAVELNMVSDGGLLAATNDSVKVRVPYAFGLTCRRVNSQLLVSLVPPDSLTFATAVPDGIAWRSAAGTYVFPPGTLTATASTDSAACRADSIRVVPRGRLLGLAGVPSGIPWDPAIGSIAYLYRTVTYKFAASVDLPGRRALWRKAGSAAYEELAAPFAATARFRFLVGHGLTAQSTPPSNLSTVRGLELRLVGASETTPRGAAGPQTFELVSQVRFVNKAD